MYSHTTINMSATPDNALLGLDPALKLPRSLDCLERSRNITIINLG